MRLAAALLAASVWVLPALASEPAPASDSPLGGDDNTVEMPMLVAPVTVNGRLYHYAYMRVMLEARDSATVEMAREKVPYIIDALQQARDHRVRTIDVDPRRHQHYNEQLQAALQERVDVPVEIAMRYGNPTPAAAFDRLMERNPGLEEVVAVPLYPHYAMASYETAVEYAREVYASKQYPFKLSFIKPFYDDADYIAALAESMRPYLEQSYDHILFSYHGIPARHLLKTDTTGSHCMKVNDCCNVRTAEHA